MNTENCKVCNLIKTTCPKLIAIAKVLQCPFLLIIRLYWGWQFFLAGKGKLTNIERTIGFFQGLKIPAPALNAYLVGTIEMIGGSLLILGLGTRLTTIPLIGTMIVAYLTAHHEELEQIFTDPDKFFAAGPFLFLYACVILFLFGPGKISIDNFLKKRCASE